MTFNNPERHNAINLEMQQAIPVILEDFAADPDVRVVVLRGAGGKSFVSGADISEFESRRSNPEAIAEYSAIAGRANAAYRALGKAIRSGMDLRRYELITIAVAARLRCSY